jgi:AbrB family looped-hinge helix DNA binding protein
MAKVTSKLQVTVPKAIADRYGIKPGDEIERSPQDAIRAPPARQPHLDTEARLRLFDAATERQRRRQTRRARPRLHERGWRRQDLYDRAALVDTNVLAYR